MWEYQQSGEADPLFLGSVPCNHAENCVGAEMYSPGDLMNALYLSFPYAGIYCFKEIRLILLTFRHFFDFLPY